MIFLNFFLNIQYRYIKWISFSVTRWHAFSRDVWIQIMSRVVTPGHKLSEYATVSKFSIWLKFCSRFVTGCNFLSRDDTIHPVTSLDLAWQHRENAWHLVTKSEIYLKERYCMIKKKLIKINIAQYYTQYCS